MKSVPKRSRSELIVVRPGEKIEEELGLEKGKRIDGTKIFACEGED